MSDGKRAEASFDAIATRGVGARTFGALCSRARSQVGLLCWAGAALAIVGCASPEPNQAFDPQLAKTVDATASQAAVAKPGTKVCRWVPLGIAEKDLLRGVVQQSEGRDIRVRIEDPGRFLNSLNGHQIARGEVIRDTATSWSPCAS